MKIETIIALILTALNSINLLFNFSLKLKIKAKSRLKNKIEKLNEKTKKLMTKYNEKK